MTFKRVRKAVYILLAVLILTACGAAEEEQVQVSGEFECDIYSSYGEGGYCYTLLSDAEKNAYMSLSKGIFNMDESIDIGVGGADSIERVVTAIYYDHPEYFWFSRGASYEMRGSYSTVRPEYGFTEEEAEEYEEAVNAYVEKVCSQCMGYDNDYDRIKKAYEYVILNTSYGSGENDQNILSVMVDGRSVCAGYSKALQLVLSELGYETAYVTGSDESSGSHAWNIVRIDDEWYNIDATWGDPVYTETDEDMEGYVTYAYLLVSDDALSENHKKDNSFIYPVCTSDEYDYYEMNGTYLDVYDYDEMLSKIKDAIDSGAGSIEFKLSTDEEFEKASEAVENGRILRKTLWYRMYRNFSFSTEICYITEKNMRTITIFFDIR